MNINHDLDQPLIELDSLTLKYNGEKIADELSLILNSPTGCHIYCDNRKTARVVYEALAYKKHIVKGRYAITSNTCNAITSNKKPIGILTVRQNFDFFWGLYHETINHNFSLADFQNMLELSTKQWESKFGDLSNNLTIKISIAISLLIPFNLYIFRYESLQRSQFSDEMKLFLYKKLSVTGHVCILCKDNDDLFLPVPGLKRIISSDLQGK